MDPGAPENDALLNLQKIVYENLKHQHYWTLLKLHSEDDSGRKLARPLVSGIPPKPVYIHPDAAIAKETAAKEGSAPSSSSSSENTVVEIALPVHIEENVSLKFLAEVFDSLPDVRQSTEALPSGEMPKKRVCLAVVSGDSTVVYYIMHDGIVKPRQN